MMTIDRLQAISGKRKLRQSFNTTIKPNKYRPRTSKSKRKSRPLTAKNFRIKQNRVSYRNSSI